MRSIQTSITRLAACSALAFGACAAHADLYNFALTGAYTASWQMDSSATPIDSSFGAEYHDVTGTFMGSTDNIVQMSFVLASEEGGLSIWDFEHGDGGLFSGRGAQVFTGTEADPTFQPGTYDLIDAFTGQHSTLTIWAADTPSNDVPEPQTYALLLASAGAMALAMRRRSTKA
jgi:hypothetical protein